MIDVFFVYRNEGRTPISSATVHGLTNVYSKCYYLCINQSTTYCIFLSYQGLITVTVLYNDPG